MVIESAMKKFKMPWILSVLLAAGAPMVGAAGSAGSAGSPLEQFHQVMAQLKELNPGFDGRETHRFEGGVLTELSFSSAAVTNLSPVRVLTDLRRLSCRGTPDQHPLRDLAALRGLMLAELDIRDTDVTDLSPLEKMPLKELRCDLWVVANKESARLLVEKRML